jgi:tRNA nucleotidyltransferase (CCA-adding enzyme)
MMLHDIAKPPCKTKDIHGVDHFYGHNQMGADMAVEILGRLRYENLIIMKVRDLILYHDAEIHDNIKSVRRWLNRIGEERFRELIKVKVADIFGQNEDFFFERMNKFLEIGVLIDEVIEKNQCFSKRDLAINGRDLMDAGYPQGKMIGFIIDALVDKVIENPEYNTKEKLLEIVPTIRGFRRLTGVIEEGMK